MTAFSVALQLGAYPPDATSAVKAVAASATLLGNVFAVVVESTDEQASDAEIYSLAIVPIVSALEEASSAELSYTDNPQPTSPQVPEPHPPLFATSHRS
jgi:hypothetical protein